MVTEVGFETSSVPRLDEGGGVWLEPPVEGAGPEGPVASSPPPQAAVARASVARTELKKRRADIVTSCESLHRFRGHRVEHGGNDTRRCHRQLTGIPSDPALAQVIVRSEPGDRASGPRTPQGAIPCRRGTGSGACEAGNEAKGERCI